MRRLGNCTENIWWHTWQMLSSSASLPGWMSHSIERFNALAFA